MTDFEINGHMYVRVGCIRLWMWGVLVFRLLARHFCGTVSASDQPGPLVLQGGYVSALNTVTA